MIDSKLLDEYSAFIKTPEYISKAKKLEAWSKNAWREHLENEKTFSRLSESNLSIYPSSPSRAEMKQIFIDILGMSEKEAEKASQDPKLIVRD